MDRMASTSSSSSSSISSLYPQIPTAQIYKPNGKRLQRKDLSKMSTRRLFALLEELEARADVANSDLVQLLLKRDQLHLENDSLKLEVEDLLNFNTSQKLEITRLIHVNNNPKAKQQRCK